MASSPAKPRRTLEQTVFLQLQKTADDLMAEFAVLIKPHDLSPEQYNVLRILRAAGDAGLASGKITERMLTREPDMTRLLDRLEKRNLIRRDRDKSDRRIVRAVIMADGLKLLATLDESILELHHRQLRHLDRDKLKSLSDLLESARHRT
jgi:DNA-binding MarR family transcriptional regulator